MRRFREVEIMQLAWLLMFVAWGTSMFALFSSRDQIGDMREELAACHAEATP